MSQTVKGYAPIMGGRTTVVQRTSVSRGSTGGGYGGYGGYSSRMSMTGPAFASGTYQHLSSTGVASVRDSRNKEKKEMQGLNERLAGYIETVKFLEAKIIMLEDMLKRAREEEKIDLQPIHDMLNGELAQARRVIDEMSKEKAGVDAKMAGLQDEIQRQNELIDINEKHKSDYLTKINQLTTQVGEYEGELGSLRLRIRNLEDENDKLRELHNKANDDIRKLRNDLDLETSAHIEASNRAQSAEEELDFVKAILAKLPKECNHNTQIQGLDMKVWWDKQLSQAIKDMAMEYDNVVSTMRDEMQMRADAQYRQLQSGALKENLESGHLREEVKKLKTQLSDKNSALLQAEARARELEAEVNRLAMELNAMRCEYDELKVKYSTDVDRLNSELEGCIHEIQMIMDAKLSLELEICCYRQLLEGEENRSGLKQIVEQAVGMQGGGGGSLKEFISTGGTSSINSEASGRMTQSRSSRGPFSFVHASVDGSYIEIENNTSGTKAKTQSLKGWQMKKQCSGKPDIVYTFPDVQMRAGQKYRIYAKGNPPAKGENVGCDYCVNDDVYSFGGGSGTVCLMDEFKNEKATLKSTISNLK